VPCGAGQLWTGARIGGEGVGVARELVPAQLVAVDLRGQTGCRQRGLEVVGDEARLGGFGQVEARVRRRDGWLVRQGWTVMRYSAHDVMISREYVRWAGLDICSFYLGQKTLEEIRAGSAGFEAELADHYPHLVVPVGVCVACRGTGKCEGLCTTRLRGL